MSNKNAQPEQWNQCIVREINLMQPGGPENDEYNTKLTYSPSNMATQQPETFAETHLEEIVETDRENLP